MNNPSENSSHILTFIASNNDLSQETLNIAGDFKNLTWLSPNKAADITLMHEPNPAAITYIRDQLAKHQIDVLVTPAENRKKKLLLADMDSTIVTSETLDDLAAHAGIKEQIAEITARAMNGELNFHDAIRQRVALIKGLPTEALNETLTETQLTAGAKIFVQTMKKYGATCVLVSGGFTFFTKSIASQCGFDHHHGNTLDIADNKLTGRVIDPILDKDTKLKLLNEYILKTNHQPLNTMTIGDGANDLPMLQAAGLGLGFHAKPSVAAQLTNTILYNDLTAALYAQGYREKEFVNA